MKKIIAAIAALLLSLVGIVTVATTTAPTSSAAGCGSVQHRTSAVSTGDSNLLIAGRPITFKLHVDMRDCDGYDQITGVFATIHKDGGNCKNVWAETDGYRLNPNAIGDANPYTQWVNCVGGLTSGTTDYIVTWNVYEKITSSMPKSARCISMVGEVDLIAQTDPPDKTTPALCFNGL